MKRAKTVLRPDVALRVRPARPVPVPVGGTEFIHLGTRVRPPRHVAMPTVRTRAVKRPSVWRTVGFFFGAITVSFTLHGLYYL